MSNFSRKHYIRVAAIIKKAWDSAKGHPAAIDAITCLEWDFIEMFALYPFGNTGSLSLNYAVLILLFSAVTKEN